MDLAAGQLPDQPGIDGAEQQAAGFGLFPGARHVFQNPLQFGGRKIGVDDKAGLLAEEPGQAADLERVAGRTRAPALPDNRRADRFAGCTVPDNGCLALVGNADRRDLRRRDAGLVHGRQRHAELGGPDFIGIVFHPARFGEILGEGFLRHAHNPAGRIKQDAPV